MDSNQVAEVIELVATTASKNEKTAIISKYKDDPTFQKVLNLTLNPFITFGMQKVPSRALSTEGGSFSDSSWELLEMLSDRSLSGNAARDAVQNEINALSPASADLLTRIIRKDLKAGFGESTVNKVLKGFIPEFPYMRCSLPKDVKLNEWDWDSGIFSQEKADGMFANIDHDKNGVVSIRSRQGSEFPMDKFQRIAEEVAKYITPATQSHGEFLVMVDGVIAERQIGNGIMNRVIKGGDFAENEVPVLRLWDSIPIDSVKPKGKYNVPYAERLSKLFEQLPLESESERNVNVIETRTVYSLKEAYGHYKDMLLEGKEGTIIKSRTGIWSDSTSKNQVKLKLEFVVDLVVTAIVDGEVGGKNEGRPGSLKCMTADHLLEVDVTVKNEKMRDHVEANPDEWIGSIIAVLANDIIEPSKSNPSHSLFLPRMVEADYRLDKSEADTLERVKAQYQAAIDASNI